MSNTNPNTRAIVAAFRSDHKPLRVCAAKIVDKVTAQDGKSPLFLVQMAFEASESTARTILTERARFDQSGELKTA